MRTEYMEDDSTENHNGNFKTLLYKWTTQQTANSQPVTIADMQILTEVRSLSATAMDHCLGPGAGLYQCLQWRTRLPMPIYSQMKTVDKEAPDGHPDSDIQLGSTDYIAGSSPSLALLTIMAPSTKS